MHANTHTHTTTPTARLRDALSCQARGRLACQASNRALPLRPPPPLGPQSCVQVYTLKARALLALYDGYECKEPEPGKFTLVFQ